MTRAKAIYEHDDGRLCRYLAYALDTHPEAGLMHAYFYGLPPDMRRCHRDHPGGADDPAAEA